MDSVATASVRTKYTAKEEPWQRTERELLVNTGPNDIRVNDQPVGHVIQCKKNRVGQQELQAVSMFATGDGKRGRTISGISIRRMAPGAVSIKTGALRQGYPKGAVNKSRRPEKG